MPSICKNGTTKTQWANLFKSTELTLKSKACPLGRYPLSSYLAPHSGVLELPWHYLSAFGCDWVSWRLCTSTSYDWSTTWTRMNPSVVPTCSKQAQTMTDATPMVFKLFRLSIAGAALLLRNTSIHTLENSIYEGYRFRCMYYEVQRPRTYLRRGMMVGMKDLGQS